MSALTGRTPRDANRAPVLFGVSDTDGVTVVPIHADPATGRLFVNTTGSVTVSFSAPTTAINGKTTVTTAGTRVQLATNTCVSITIKALASNTGTIYVGNSTVSSTNGYQLAAGDSISADISNTNKFYIDSSVNGEGVTWLAVN